MINPLSFMLEPNSKRIIRMGFKQPIASMQLQEEAAWRIIFTPLPDAKKAKGLKYAYSFNVPLFAGKDFKPEMSFQLAKNNKNQPVLLAKNSGTAHFQITGLKLQDTAGKDIFNSKELKYVLPRKQVSFDLNTLAVKPDAGLKLTVQTAGSETLQFDVAE
jgi:fimbrial chaperone protein